ncbi:hypothetical protein F2Q70_00040294 [Brassica cretica]|uniref:EGF-like domain-containing protein n=1 Tax=Brassica cretica TaxID=69181 RepID=A0A8S9KCC9_BRACR|nr:hypothetical protein F2Q70_00040294 [Brassica cretica]
MEPPLELYGIVEDIIWMSNTFEFTAFTRAEGAASDLGGYFLLPCIYAAGCYYADDPSFHLTCNDKEKLLFESDLEVINISHSGEQRVWNNVSYACYGREGKLRGEASSFYTLANLSLSHKNKFNVVGCNALALLSTAGARNQSSGCFSECGSRPPPANGDCSGEGCCMTDVSVPFDSNEFYTGPSRTEDTTPVFDFNPCTYAFVAENGTFRFDALEDLKNLRNVTKFPLVLDWSIGNQTCEQVRNKSICGMKNSTCFDSTRRPGYNCKCLEDINECTTNSTIHKHNCSKPSTCRNKVGGFDCKCQSGYRLDTTNMSCKRKDFGWATILLGKLPSVLIVS